MTTPLSSTTPTYPLLSAWHGDRLAEQWGNEKQSIRAAMPCLSKDRAGHLAAAKLCVDISDEYALLENDVKQRVDEHQGDAECSDDLLDFYDALQDDSRPFWRAELQSISGNRAIFEDEFDYQEKKEA